MSGGKPHLLLVLTATASLALAVSQTFAQTSTPARASAPKSSAQSRIAMPGKILPQDGAYFAADDIRFMVDHVNGQVRLRFQDSDEVFYLSSEPASLGGRLLKYDTGDTALIVAGWGGVTLYTDAAPNGVAAERTGDAGPLDPEPVSGSRVKPFAANLSQDLSDQFNLAVGIAADWETLNADDRKRAAAMDAMRNATLALARVARARGGRSRASRISVIRAVEAPSPGVTVENGVLTVSFNLGAPASKPARPSSLAVAHAIMNHH